MSSEHKFLEAIKLQRVQDSRIPTRAEPKLNDRFFRIHTTNKFKINLVRQGRYTDMRNSLRDSRCHYLKTRSDYGYLLEMAPSVLILLGLSDHQKHIPLGNVDIFESLHQMNSLKHFRAVGEHLCRHTEQCLPEPEPEPEIHPRNSCA